MEPSIEASCLFTYIPNIKATRCCSGITQNRVLLYSEVCTFHMPTMRQLYLKNVSSILPLGERSKLETTGDHLVPQLGDFNFTYCLKVGIGPSTPTNAVQSSTHSTSDVVSKINGNCGCFKF